MVFDGAGDYSAILWHLHCERDDHRHDAFTLPKCCKCASRAHRAEVSRDSRIIPHQPHPTIPGDIFVSLSRCEPPWSDRSRKTAHSMGMDGEEITVRPYRPVRSYLRHRNDLFDHPPQTTPSVHHLLCSHCCRDHCRRSRQRAGDKNCPPFPMKC